MSIVTNNNSNFINDSMYEVNNIKNQINQFINDNNNAKLILDKVEKEIKILSNITDSILNNFDNIKKFYNKGNSDDTKSLD